MDNNVIERTGWIGVDLDGTLAEYTDWTGPYSIGKPIKPMVRRIQKWVEAGWEVRIFTARVAIGQYGKEIRNEIRSTIGRWCKQHIGFFLPVTCVKDYECVAIYDDRAVAVELNTGKILGGKEIG